MPKRLASDTSSKPSLLAFTALPSAFIPDEDQGYLAGFFQLQNGASLSETQRVSKQIAAIVNEEGDVLNTSVISGYGFNGSSPDQGTILIGLKPLRERPGAANSSFAIADRLNAKLSALSSALAVVGQPPAVPGFSAQGGFYFQFNDLSGNYSFNQLDEQAQTLIKAGKLAELLWATVCVPVTSPDLPKAPTPFACKRLITLARSALPASTAPVLKPPPAGNQRAPGPGCSSPRRSSVGW